MYNSNDFHYWQLVTAHFSHYDWQHLGSNVFAFAMLLYLFPATLKQRVTTCLTAIVFINVYLLLADISYYAGFSGLNYALLGLASYCFIENKKYLKAILITLGIILYMLASPNKVHFNNVLVWHSLQQAHLLGFIAAFASQYLIKKLTKEPRLEYFKQKKAH